MDESKNNIIPNNKNYIFIKPSSKINNINLYPQQAGSFLELMPANFIYNLLKWNINEKESNFIFEIDLASVEEFHLWFEAFKIKTRSQFNVRTSKKGEGKFILLRTLYKCIHNVHGGILGKRKHTGCPTQLLVTIYPPKMKRYHLANQECIGICKMQLRWNHNHPLIETDAIVCHTQMDKRLQELFNKGHNPTTARQALLTEAENNGKDSVMVPDYKHIYYVFRKLGNHECRDNFNNKVNVGLQNMENGFVNKIINKNKVNDDKDNKNDDTHTLNSNITTCNELHHENAHIGLSEDIGAENQINSKITNFNLENGREFNSKPMENANESLELDHSHSHQEMTAESKVDTITNLSNRRKIFDKLKSESIEIFNSIIELSLSNTDTIEVLEKLNKFMKTIKTPRASVWFLRKIGMKRRQCQFKRKNRLTT